jgi:hypothetical protein
MLMFYAIASTVFALLVLIGFYVCGKVSDANHAKREKEYTPGWVRDG